MAETKDTKRDSRTYKHLTDCSWFLSNSCKNGDKCAFRHCEATLTNKRDCNNWAKGICYNGDCSFRHPKVQQPSKALVLSQNKQEKQLQAIRAENDAGLLEIRHKMEMMQLKHEHDLQLLRKDTEIGRLVDKNASDIKLAESSKQIAVLEVKLEAEKEKGKGGPWGWWNPNWGPWAWGGRLPTYCCHGNRWGRCCMTGPPANCAHGYPWGGYCSVTGSSSCYIP